MQFMVFIQTIDRASSRPSVLQIALLSALCVCGPTNTIYDSEHEAHGKKADIVTRLVPVLWLLHFSVSRK